MTNEYTNIKLEQETVSSNYNKFMDHLLTNLSYINYNEDLLYSSLKHSLLLGTSLIELSEFLAYSINIILKSEIYYSPKKYLYYLFMYSDELAEFSKEKNYDKLMLVLRNVISNVHLNHIDCRHEFINNIDKCAKCKSIAYILLYLGKMENIKNNLDRITTDFHIKYDNFHSVIPDLTNQLKNNQLNYFNAVATSLCQYGRQYSE